MDVCNEAIAASAVDLVVAQLHRNERGVPTHPTSLLLDGTWREESEDKPARLRDAPGTLIMKAGDAGKDVNALAPK